MHTSRVIPLMPSSRRGAVLVLAAICLIIVIAFTAFSVDWGYMVLTEGELQNAADSGALAGARCLPDGNSAAISAAQSWAGKNIAAGSSVAVAKSDVELGTWDTDAAKFTVLASNSATSPNAVRVTCRRSTAGGTGLKLFFAPLLGQKTADLKASAIGRLKSSRCGLIIGLNSVVMSGSSHTDSYNASNGSYNTSSAGEKGHVCTNGDISMSGSATIHGDAHYGSGHSVKSSGSANVTGQESALATPLAFAAVDASGAAASNDNHSIPLTDFKKDPLNSKNEFSMSGGDGIDLPPGTYYFSKLSLSGSSFIRISGQTSIYVTGDVSLSGGTVINHSMLPKDFALFPMGSKCDVSGSSEFYGMVYGPNTNVIRSGNADYFGALIGKTLVLSGEGGIHADESLDAQYLGGGNNRSVLAE